MTANDLDVFLSGHLHDVRMPGRKPSREAARAMLAGVDMPRSVDLEQYLVTYGQLALGTVQMYGMDGSGASDMRDATERLRRDFCMTDGYAALEALDGGRFALCDGHGRVFRFDPQARELTDLWMQLWEYILGRFRGELPEDAA